MTLTWSIETYERLSSTQDELKDRLNQGDEVTEGLVIQAIEQNAGRGRQGRLWYSPPGNLYMSLLLKPGCSLARSGSLSLVMALSIVRALERLAGEQIGITLKWPNDVFLNGKKCAGVLLETETDASGNLSHVIAGIGINVITAPADLGTALYDDRKFKSLTLSGIRDKILQEIARDYPVWLKKGFAPFKEEWLKRTCKTGTEITVGHFDRAIRGTFSSIDEKGNLIITDPEGQERKIASGEIIQNS